MPFELDDDWFAGVAETRTMTERERFRRLLDHKPKHDVLEIGEVLRRDAAVACVSYRFGLERTIRFAEWFGELDDRPVISDFDGNPGVVDDRRVVDGFQGTPEVKTLLEYERCLPKIRSMLPANITIDSIGDKVNLDVDPDAQTVRISAGNTSSWSIRR